MPRHASVTALLAIGLAAAGCDSGGPGPGAADSGPDGGPDPDGDPDAGAGWSGITDGGDAIGDCDAEDEACAADIADLLYLRDGDALWVELRMAEGFPEDGTFEIFLIPPDVENPGVSFRYHGGALQFWLADCSTAKHEGCHWYDLAEPSSFAGGWIDGATYRCTVSLGQLALDGLGSLRMGVGAAHEAITATAEFTDRFPDALWITSSEIQGLAEAPLD